MNEDFNEKNFKPSSVEPMIRVQGMNADLDDSSSSDDSDDSDHLYYNFDSSDEQHSAIS